MDIGLISAAIFFTILGTSVTYVIVSWLYDHEINYSLKLAQDAETKLQKERDLLEIKVMERTKHIENLQIERITVLHQRAVSSKQISGFFHDLMNSLTAVNLAIEHVTIDGPATIEKTKIHLSKAIISSRRMTEFVDIIRHYNNPSQSLVEYSLRDEIRKIITLHDYRANKSNIAIRLFAEGHDTAYGKPAELYQILNNLISHAISNYGEPVDEKLRYLDITIKGDDDQRAIKVKDYSIATATDAEKKIYGLFNETSINDPESDLGLAIAKQLVNQKLKGSLSITDNARSAGTTATILFKTRLT